MLKWVYIFIKFSFNVNENIFQIRLSGQNITIKINTDDDVEYAPTADREDKAYWPSKPDRKMYVILLRMPTWEKYFEESKHLLETFGSDAIKN